MNRSALLAVLLLGVILCGPALAQPAPPEADIPFPEELTGDQPGGDTGGFPDDFPGDQPGGEPQDTAEGFEDVDTYLASIAKTPCPRYCPKGHVIPAETLLYLLALLIAATLVIRTRRRAWWMGVVLAVSLVVMGFWRHGCICPVGSVSNIAAALASGGEFLLHKGVVMLFVLPLVFALLFGRVFCGGVCPFGAIQQLLASKHSLRAHPIDRVLRFGRWIMLGVVLISAIWFSVCALCRIDPFLPILQIGGVALHNAAAAASDKPLEPMSGYVDVALWTFPATFLLLCVLIARPFCRWLCPYAVLLGLLSKISFVRRRIESSSCINCKLCTKACPTQAIETLPAEGEDDKPTQCIDPFNCVSCGKCSDVCPADAVK